ncbi:MAG: hypothetical protein SGI99_10760 [Pseudomonadota bacterium]|nr:hypothetical protein [Pseudomonadota bacterium]
MVTNNLPRGIRNNNPGNIDYSDRYQWQGLDAPASDGRFCRFKSAPDGIRALARTLITYDKKHKINTIRGIINRWAPSVENNTNAYVEQVTKASGLDADQRLDLQSYAHLVEIVKAIINHENGKPAVANRTEWYAQDVIDEGLRRAGVVAPAAPLRAQPESRAAAGVATGAGLAAGGAGYLVFEVKQASDDLRAAGKAKIDSGDINTGSFFVLGGVLILVSAVGFMLWTAIKRMRLSK